MAEKRNRTIKKLFEDFKKKLIKKYDPEQIILYGSRARGDNLIESDIDLIIVSKKFKNIKWPIRIGKVAELWEGTIEIEPLCYTPEEFEIKKKQIGIVQQALKEGKNMLRQKTAINS
jgi:uncharacterized protein